MIKRLLDLTLDSFRSYNGSEHIPLDADVVLIYGPNGSGKTGLIYAIEYALTKNVADLRSFDSDYPRCLHNIRASGDVVASVDFIGKDGKKHRASSSLMGKQKILSNVLTQEEQRFFIERCYLSQARLARLLELYQVTDKDHPEQPLIRFIRELLHMDVLENLIDGLYDVGDIRRLTKSSNSLRRLNDEQQANVDLIKQLNQEIAKRAANWEDIHTQIDQIIMKFGDPVKDATWTNAGVDERINVLTKILAKDQDILKKLQYLEGRVEKISGFSAILDDSHDNIIITKNKLNEIMQKQNEIRSKLRSLESIIQREIDMLDCDISFDKYDDILQQIDAMGRILINKSKNIEFEINIYNDNDTKIKTLQTAENELNNRISQLGKISMDLYDSQQRRLELLTLALNHIDGSICPVCSRDYLDLKAEDLRIHILQEIDILGASAHESEMRAKLYSELNAELENILRHIEVLRKFQSTSKTLSSMILTKAKLDELAIMIASSIEDRNSLAKFAQERAELEHHISTTLVQQRHTKEIQSDLTFLVQELNLLVQSSITPQSATIDKIKEEIKYWKQELVNRLEEQQKLLQLLILGENALSEFAYLDKRMSDAKDSENAIAEAHNQISAMIHKTKKILKSATNVQSSLVRKIFDESLNRLWFDVYSRLTDDITFKPYISAPISIRGKVRSGIQGLADGIQPFQQLASVLSTGNLNTAALSLFLSLNLIEFPIHDIIILDDPVQSMDDIHISQLASVLRAVVRQSSRQILVSIHERALFEYLCLELGPTSSSDSLLAIDVSRDDPSKRITWNRHVWKVDTIRFG